MRKFDDIFRAGLYFTFGAIVALSACFVLGTVFDVAASYIIPARYMGYDDTDSHPDRSGLKPHTDALTGCQYLSVKGGGITPRLDAGGKHICGGQS